METKPIDPTIKNLVAAIGRAETGASSPAAYTTRGASGEYGRYQFMPDTWKQWAGETLGNPNAEMSVENQNKVAYARIEKLKAQGYSPAEIAANWNSGWEKGKSTFDFKNYSGVNSKGVKYDTGAYARKVSQYYKELAAKTAQTQATQQEVGRLVAPTNTPENPSITSHGVGALPIAKQATQFGVGLGTEIGKAGLNLGKLFLKGSNFVSKKLGLGDQYTPAINKIEDIKQKVFVDPYQAEQASLPGKLGTATGVGAEFISGGALPKVIEGGALKAASLIPKIESGALKVSELMPKLGNAIQYGTKLAARVLGGVLGDGAIELARTGGDMEKAKTLGIWSGVFSGLSSVAGDVLKSTGLPEKIMSRVFRETKADASNVFNSQAAKELKQENPEAYAEMLKRGIFKEGANEEIVVNKTLAQKALERGMKGSVDFMGTQVIKGAKQTELAVQKLAEAFKGNLQIDKKIVDNLLVPLAKRFKNVGNGDEAKFLVQMAKKIKSGGTLNAQETLQLRRFLDRMSRFPEDTTNLSTSMKNIKYWGDILRGKINGTSPEMAEAMKNYQFYIEAADELAKRAKESNNRALLSAFDRAELGYGALGHPAVGFLPIIKKIGQSTGLATNIAQGIERGVGPTAKNAIRGVKGAILNAVTPSQ